MKRALTGIVIAIVLLLAAGCRTSHDSDDQFLQRFMGTWKYEENGETYTLDLKDNVETVGVYQSETLSRGEFKIDELNRDVPYIVIHGFSEDLTAANPESKTEYYSKLTLTENDSKLLYVYDYKREKIESVWHR